MTGRHLLGWVVAPGARRLSAGDSTAADATPRQWPLHRGSDRRRALRMGDGRLRRSRGVPHGWIDASFVEAYTTLHELGWAHSVECWDDEGACRWRLRDLGRRALRGRIDVPRRSRGLPRVRLLRPHRGAPAATTSLRRRILDAQWHTPHLGTPRRAGDPSRGVQEAFLRRTRDARAGRLSR